MDEFLGIIKMFAGNFAPRSWALCQGQILSIAQNTALFSILGTTFGGNGQTTFALPDFRGRSPTGQGQGPGLPAMSLGEQAGTPTVTILGTNLPSFGATLTPKGSTRTDISGSPLNAIPAAGGSYDNAAPAGNQVNMAPQQLVVNGSNQPMSIQQPYLCVNFIICLEGLFPSRN
jgi:microcystin-dependent protein